MDYDQLLSSLRTLVCDADKAMEETKPLIDSISENYKILQQLDSSDPSVTYLPLEHSKQMEFVNAIPMMLDVIKSLSVLESVSQSRLKASLQQAEEVYQRNGEALKSLERANAELRSFNPNIISVSEKKKKMKKMKKMKKNEEKTK